MQQQMNPGHGTKFVTLPSSVINEFLLLFNLVVDDLKLVVSTS